MAPTDRRTLSLLLAEAEEEARKYKGRIYRPRLTDEEVWMLYNLLEKDLRNEAGTLTWMRKRGESDPHLVERHKMKIRVRRKLEKLHVRFEKRSKAARAEKVIK
jgi:hypothetical protein